MPAKVAASGVLTWRVPDWDESAYKSVTNEDLTTIGQTKGFIKLDDVKTPVMMEFLVCTDEGDEALLSLDTLKELTTVPCDFPKPIDKNMREPKIRRVKDNEDEWEEEEKSGEKGALHTAGKSRQSEDTFGDEGND